MKAIERIVLAGIVLSSISIALYSQAPEQRAFIAHRAVFGEMDHALSPPSVEGASGQKDSSAVDVVRKYLVLSGTERWSGFSGSGSFTAGRGEQIKQGTAEIAIEPNDYTRFDIHYPAGSRSIRLAGPVGAVQQEDGTVLHLPAETATVGIVLLPITISALLEDESTSFVDDGMIEVNGTRLHKVTLVRQLPNSSTSPVSLVHPIATMLLFDPTSHLLLKSVDVLLLPGTNNTKHLRVLTYDDYRDSEGVTLPYRFTETLDGLPSWTLTLTTASVKSVHQSSYFQF